MFPRPCNKQINASRVICNKQHGSALVIAIFIIVVMTLLGAALIRMLAASSESIAYEVIGTRAYATAQVGAQWAGREIFPLGVATARHCDGSTVSPSNTTFISPQTLTPPANISNNDGLKDCEIVTVLCADFKYDDVAYLTITSTGQCEVAGVITSRTIVIEARSL